MLSFPPEPPEISKDDVVQSTNDDAATSKLEAIKKGYYKDEALVLLMEGVPTVPRAPIMLRGYYIRTFIMRDIVRNFLQHDSSTTFMDDSKKRQIVNLGAGFDTLYFWLAENHLLTENTKYFELDFLPVCQRKLRSLTRQQKLMEIIGKFSKDAVIDANVGELRSNNYNIIPTDLRDISRVSGQLQEHGFDLTVPTLFLSECVLIYLKAQHSQAIVQWIKGNVTTGIMACYEQIKPNDPFGRVMIQNLERRGCALLGLTAFPDEESQKRRFLQEGWDRAECYNMNILYAKYVSNDDRKRIERLQMLDEVEEWILINDHYCISWAIVNSENSTDWSSLQFLK